GAKEVTILVADRPERVRQIVGDGARWGLRVEIAPQSHELNCAEVRSMFSGSKIPSAFGTHETIFIDHSPGLPQLKLFSSYAAFFGAIQKVFSEIALKSPFGMKEIRPGVWTGFRAHIAPDA